MIAVDFPSLAISFRKMYFASFTSNTLISHFTVVFAEVEKINNIIVVSKVAQVHVILLRLI